MKKTILKVIVPLLIAMIFWGCKKPQTYSPIPSITFRSLVTEQYVSGKDSVGILTISFVDGDGDIGYYQPPLNGNPYDDTLSIYYDDFVVIAFNKQNGVWVQDTSHYSHGRSPFSARLPYLTPTGDNKTLKGEISMTLQLPPVTTPDTVHYQVYIYDRALHQSNTITTSDIVVTTF